MALSNPLKFTIIKKKKKNGHFVILAIIDAVTYNVWITNFLMQKHLFSIKYHGGFCHISWNKKQKTNKQRKQAKTKQNRNKKQNKQKIKTKQQKGNKNNKKTTTANKQNYELISKFIFHKKKIVIIFL